MSKLVNFVLYQVGWFACVLGMAWERPWLGMLGALALVGIHVCLTQHPASELKLISVAGTLGLVLDSFQLWLGVFSFTSGQLTAWLAPPCVVVMWIQFATILPYCLSWLSRRYVLSSLLGFTGGPLAFFGGARLGAVTFLPPQLPHYLMLGLLWGLAFPFLVWSADQLCPIREAYLFRLAGRNRA
jgi:hypothetical protein